MTQHTWKDIIKIKHNIIAEEVPVTKPTSSDRTPQFNEFMKAVAEKYHVNQSEIKTYTKDDINFNAQFLPFGADSCGYNIDGQPEWYYLLD